MRLFSLSLSASLLLAGVNASAQIPQLLSQSLAWSAPGKAQNPRERIRFDEGWKFFRGDAADAGDSLNYHRLRPYLIALNGNDLINVCDAPRVAPTGNPGGGVSFVQPNFDDNAWKAVTLPHDWAISGPFSADLPGETGKLPWQGAGWYRKHFEVPAGDAGKQVSLDIDGAMSYSSIWLNGHYLGGWPYGFTSYRIDLTPFLQFGGQNVLAIRLENPVESSRWYPGAGIYRDVWLVKTARAHLKHWGVFVTTPRVTDDVATVQADISLVNETGANVPLELSVSIHEVGTDGSIAIASVVMSHSLHFGIDPSKGMEAERSISLELPHPQRWSLANRHRYAAITTLTQNGQVIDEETSFFGVRTIAFTAADGFLLNGQHVPLQGVCLHHDEGSLGAAVSRRALQRQLEILQAMGCNAIRTSHNPPSPELLDLCDQMGFVVMDEAFDCWQIGKKEADLKAPEVLDRYHDYARIFGDWYEKDLRALIRRDRNHPCVVLWSIGNEVREQERNDGFHVAAHLTGIVHEEDRTRPTVSAFNHPNSGYDGFQTAVDVVGFNYKPDEYPRFRKQNPQIPVLGSETASTVSSRGEYFFPVDFKDKLSGRANFQVNSYDLSAPPWALPPDDEFRGLDAAPYAAGEFVWTGFDYIGEPTPYNSDSTNLLNFTDPAMQAKQAEELKALGKIAVPSRSSYFGIIDLAGFPKDRYYIYQARWRPDFPMVHILPHWNWPERIGQVTPVHVYSSGDEVELFLNGQSLGRQKRAPGTYRFQWNDVVYKPGELKAMAYRRGKSWAETTLRTSGAATQVRLAPDRAEIAADGRDLSFVTVAVTDAMDQTVPRTHNLVTFELEGPAEIAGVDNGDATSFEPFQASERKVFNGLALVIIRSKPGARGKITLHAHSAGLREASTEIVAK